jgi:hypothetical protein
MEGLEIGGLLGVNSRLRLLAAVGAQFDGTRVVTCGVDYLAFESRSADCIGVGCVTVFA